MPQVYVLYAPETLEDCKDVIKQCEDSSKVSIASFLYKNMPYNPRDAHYISYGKYYIIGFTGTLSCGYQSNNKVEYYSRIVLSKRQFIFYMLNHTWNTFNTLSNSNVQKWLKENMPIQYCERTQFNIINYASNSRTNRSYS